MSLREACNIAYSVIIDEMGDTFRAHIARGAEFEGTNPLGDQIMRMEEEIGLRVNPADIALAMHRQWMAQQGKEWDDTPVAANDRWWDQDIEFSDMEQLNRALTKPGS